ncbi:MAG: hypothetical protein J0M08_11260 [Bacteroidetes bacterium]|nr:hypothetical protein [Bacteroidota bacterium]
MNGIKFNSDRISVENPKENYTEVTIKAFFVEKKSQILKFWLIAWLIGGIALISQLFFVTDSQTKVGIIVWAGFWVYFLQFAYKAYQWRKHGYEKIIFDAGVINYYRQVFKPYKQETVNVGSIRDVQVVTYNERNFFQNLTLSYWSISGERIVLDTSIGVIRIGMELTDNEAKQLVKLIKSEMGRN